MTLNRSLVSLAGPMILANVSVALLGMVDTAVVGHLDGAQYLGGVALASVIFDFLFWGFAFLRMSTTGRVAQHFGADRFQAARDQIAQAMLLAVVLASAVLLASGGILNLVLPVLDGSAEVKEQAGIYYRIKVFSAPALFLQYVLIGAFIGIQNTRAPMVVAITLNVINVTLDFLFVFGFGWGVEGVALASVLAEFSAVALSLVLLRRLMRNYDGRFEPGAMFRWRQLLDHLGLNGAIMVRTLCLIFTFAFFTNAGARQGDTILAANAILLKFLMLMALGLDGFAQAAEALVGRFFGARDVATLKRVVALGSRWSLGFALWFTAFYGLFGEQLVGLMTDIPAVEETASAYLIWAVAAPLIATWPFLYDGIFIGATRGRDMMTTMFLATFCVFLPIWWFARPLGNHGLWLAMLAFFAARGLLLAVAWRRVVGGLETAGRAGPA